MTSRERRVELGVFAAAVGLRLAVPLLGGGLRGYAGYDPGVYYAAALVPSRLRMPTAGGPLAVALVATVLRLGDSGLIVAPVLHRDALARGRPSGGATSGSPGAPIALDKSFAPGCAPVVDLFAQRLVSGQFGASASHRTAAYLTLGDAVLLVPGTATMTRADHRRVTRGGVLATNGGWTLYRVAH